MPQFLAVGHAVQDLTSDEDPEAWRPGGTVCYAAALARNLGLDTAVVTAAAPGAGFERLLPGIAWHVAPSESTTRFRNVYDGGMRRQTVISRAAAITAADVPAEWRDTPIVLLGPVAGDLDGSVAPCFRRPLIGAGAQGWLREIGAGGRVRPASPAQWRDTNILRCTRVLFVSDEDVEVAEAPPALRRWAEDVEIVAYTRGQQGADVCFRGEWCHVAAFASRAVDLTGAGDIFAAAYLIRLYETADPWRAARFASCAASFVVEAEGLAGVPDRLAIHLRLREHPGIQPVRVWGPGGDRSEEELRSS